MSNFISKTITPGNHEAKIHFIELKEKGFKNNLDNPIFDIVLHMETKPMGGNFQGFLRDPKDASKGNYLGQVGRVRYSEWGFSDGKLAGGTEISGEKEILKALKHLCTEISQLNWFQQQDEKLPTAKAMIDLINQSEMFKDHYLYWCFASRQYVNKKGWTTDDLYLPKYSVEAGKPFSKQTTDLIVYNSSIHLMKPKDAPTKGNVATPENQTTMELKEDNLGKDTNLIGDDDNNDLPF